MQTRILVLALTILLSPLAIAQAGQVLFTPALILSEEYTDNLFLDSDNEVDDYITSAGVDLTCQMLWQKSGLILNYSPTYNDYDENDDLDYWRHSANLSTWKDIGRNTRIEISDNYLRTNDPTDETVVATEDNQPPEPGIDPDRNRRGRNEYETNSAEIRLTHQFGVQKSIYTAFQYRTLRDIDPVDPNDVDDSDIATPSFGIVYYFNPKWSVEFDAYYANSDYVDVDQDDREEYNGNIRGLYRYSRALSYYVNYRHTIIDFEPAASEDYTIYEPSLGIRYEFRDNARIEIGAGYYIQEFDDSDEEEKGFNITADALKRWVYRTGYFGISASSGYSIDDDGTEDNGLNIYHEAGVEAGYNFTQRLAGTVNGLFRYDEYPNETPERDQKTLTAGVGMEWQAVRWMFLRLSYEHSNVASDIESDEYTENRAMLTIRFVPSNPIRLN